MLRPKKPFKNTTKWAAEFVCVFFGAGMRRKLCGLLPVPMRYLITNFMMPDGIKQVMKQHRPGGLHQFFLRRNEAKAMCVTSCAYALLDHKFYDG